MRINRPECIIFDKIIISKIIRLRLRRYGLTRGKIISMKLLFGKNNPKIIVLILLCGVLLSGLIAFFIKPASFQDYLLLFLSFDIGSGLVSNATKSTKKEWFKIKPIYKYVFSIFHILIYPIIIVELSKSTEISIILIFLLYIKTAFFAYGQKNALTFNNDCK